MQVHKSDGTTVLTLTNVEGRKTCGEDKWHSSWREGQGCGVIPRQMYQIKLPGFVTDLGGERPLLRTTRKCLQPNINFTFIPCSEIHDPDSNQTDTLRPRTTASMIWWGHVLLGREGVEKGRPQLLQLSSQFRWSSTAACGLLSVCEIHHW